MKLVVAIVLSAAVASAAHAQEAPPLTALDAHLSFPTSPPEKYFPILARIHGVSGGASVLCVIGPEGALTSCRKIKEEPVGLGYLDAARKIASVARVAATANDGSATAGRSFIYEINFTFCQRSACEKAARAKMEAAGRIP